MNCTDNEKRIVQIIKQKKRYREQNKRIGQIINSDSDSEARLLQRQGARRFPSGKLQQNNWELLSRWVDTHRTQRRAKRRARTTNEHDETRHTEGEALHSQPDRDEQSDERRRRNTHRSDDGERRNHPPKRRRRTTPPPRRPEHNQTEHAHTQTQGENSNDLVCKSMTQSMPQVFVKRLQWPIFPSKAAKVTAPSSSWSSDFSAVCM